MIEFKLTPVNKKEECLKKSIEVKEEKLPIRNYDEKDNNRLKRIYIWDDAGYWLTDKKRALELESIKTFEWEKGFYVHPGNNEKFWRFFRRRGNMKPGTFKTICRLVKEKKERVK